MPTGYIKQLANKHHISIKKSETEWNKAKAVAAKRGKGENFAYITSMYKKMMGENAKDLDLKQFLVVTEMNDIGDISYSTRNRYNNEDQIDDEDFDDEDFDDEDFDDEDFNDEDDDLERHGGHKLADIISDDDVGNEECDPDTEECDDVEDEFPEEDFPGGDEIPDENGEFQPEEEDNRFKEGYHTKGSFLRELMLINEKDKSLRSAAKMVYHRDYIKTKKKQYRKYHPHNQEFKVKVNELLEVPVEEGAWDYTKGMGKYIGGRVKTAIGDKLRAAGQNINAAHQAGQYASRQGDIKSLTNQQQKLLQQLVELAKQTNHPQSIIQLINTIMGAKVNLASKMKKDFSVAFAASQQSPTNEGLFDYLRGAGRATGDNMNTARQNVNRAAGQAGQAVRGAARQVGDAVAGATSQVGRSTQQAGRAVGNAVRDIHQQGQQASLQANLQKTIQQLGQVMIKLDALKKSSVTAPNTQNLNFV